MLLAASVARCSNHIWLCANMCASFTRTNWLHQARISNL